MNIPAALMIASLLGFVVSFYNRNELPKHTAFAPQVYDEPRQAAARREDFDVVYEGTRYEINPQYEYELYGMVVSYRFHDGNSRMHLRSGDRLNMLDVCVVWGDNLHHPDLNQVKFWNGIFTCNVSTRDRSAWEAFNMYQLSNNHLISEDKFIRKQVRGLKIGDQIRVKGHLAAYGSEGGGRRGTSTTRLDTGDGACETIYVEDFAVIEASTGGWRLSMYLCLVLLVTSLGQYLRRPYRPYESNR